MYDLALMYGNCYINNTFKTTNIYIVNGKIASISDAVLPATRIVDLKGLKVLPGFIDPHVHLNLNLGNVHSTDDFETGSRAATYGGVTTLIDFLDPILDNQMLERQFDSRLQEAKKSTIDYSFHCTLGNYDDDVLDLEKKIEQLGITSIKIFTTYSESNRRCSYDVVEKLLETKVLILAHAEDDDMVFMPNKIAEYEKSRSEKAEFSAISQLIKRLEKTDGKLYVVHVSSGKTLQKLHVDHLRDRLFLESCPQYFYLSKDLFEGDDGKNYLLAPPLRSEMSIRLMKEHFSKLSTIGTDHCPFTLEEKNANEDVNKVPKGIGSLEFAFPLMYNLFGDEIIPKFTSNPATIFGLHHKGYIKEGYDADFAIVDDHKKTICHQHHSKSDYTVYDKYSLNNKVVMTILRGQIIMDEDGFYPVQGHYIRRQYESNH